MLSTVLIIVLISPMIGALPTRPDSSGWGYYPGGRIGLLLIIVIVLTVAGSSQKKPMCDLVFKFVKQNWNEQINEQCQEPVLELRWSVAVWLTLRGLLFYTRRRETFSGA